MAKFIKSIFQPNEETKRSEDNVTPPLGERRKLSISKSGRLKQSQKLRHALSLEIYGENLHRTERTKSLEYHVNTPANTPVSPHPPKKYDINQISSSVDGNKSPEEEIDNAFEIIDKT